MNRKAKTEFIDGLYNETCFEVISGTGDAFTAAQAETNFLRSGSRGAGNNFALRILDGDCSIVEIFLVIDILFVFDVGYAESDTPIDNVGEVASHIEFILVNVSFFFYFEFIFTRSAITPKSVVSRR